MGLLSYHPLFEMIYTLSKQLHGSPTEGGSAGLLNTANFKTNYFLSLLIRRKRWQKSVCFAYCLPVLFEPSYFHNAFNASELLSLMETLPSELTKRTQPQLLRSSSPWKCWDMVSTERLDLLQASKHWLCETKPQHPHWKSNPARLAECRTDRKNWSNDQFFFCF